MTPQQFDNGLESRFVLNMPLVVVLFSSSQANDRHPAVKAHGKQRDHPTKERQRDSALPIWIWIQEGQQHTSQQEVSHFRELMTVKLVQLSSS